MQVPEICQEGTFVHPISRQAKAGCGKVEQYLYYTRKELL
jgi:hypothetical protein